MSILEFLRHGGLRYKRLERNVPRRVEPEVLEAFFIGIAGRRVSISSSTTPMGAGRALASKEFVIAATDSRLHVIPIRGVGVFSWKLGETLETHPLAAAPVRWEDGVFAVGERRFQPFHYHEDDAARVAALVKAAS